MINYLIFCCASLILLSSLFHFRAPSDTISNTRLNDPVYDNIIIFFLDATGYRYVDGSSSEGIFDQINYLNQLKKKQPSNCFFTKTIAIPPSTDFTILALINGIKQQSNNFDILFKTSPYEFEDSILRKVKTALFSAKKLDWFKMTSGPFSYVDNSEDFSVQNLTLADESTYKLFKLQFPKYPLMICHFMGFDALGHALQYQDYRIGLNLLKNYNQAIQEMVKSLQNNQLLIIIGDHDQSYRGKHYQCSVEAKECEGFIFGYSKQGLHQSSQQFEYEPVDISATIHALFGFKQPTQNMGKIIPQFYPLNFTQRIKQDQDINLNQVRNHMQQLGYNLDDDLPIESLQKIFSLAPINYVRIYVSLVLMIIPLIYFSKFSLSDLIQIPSIMLPLFDYVILFYKSEKPQQIRNIIQIAILFILIIQHEIIFPKVPIEILFILCLITKYHFYRQFNFQINEDRKIILIIITIASQIIVYIFVQVDRIDFQTRRLIAIFAIFLIIVVGFIDPRLFNKGKVKVLYIVMIFMLGDISVIFQLNADYSYTQFIIFYAFANMDSCLLVARMINIHPILIPHQIYRKYKQINMNSLIILVEEFDLGPSMLSILLGYYGVFIIARLLHQEVNRNQYKIRILFNITLTILKMDQMNPINSMFLLYSLPLQLMDLLIMF